MPADNWKDEEISMIGALFMTEAGACLITREELETRFDVSLSDDAGHTFVILSASGPAYGMPFLEGRQTMLLCWKNAAALVAVATVYGERSIGSIPFQAHVDQVKADVKASLAKGDNDNGRS